MKIPIYFDPGYEAPIGTHIMPIRKFRLVAEALAGWPELEFRSHEALSRTDFLAVHTKEYVDAIVSGEPRALAESQKFPWSPALYPSVCLTSGGAFASASAALDEGGIAGALVSGFHHSCPNHGEGFCTFNGLIVTLEKLRATGRLQSAAILDMDLHYGNGTAIFSESRDWLYAFSIYGNDYWNNIPYPDVDAIRHPAGPNHDAISLPNGCRGPEMLAILEAHLPRLLARGKPDLLLYQAGADPLRDDPYSPLEITHADLLARDRRVFQFCKDNAIPVAWVLAGGYTKDTAKVVEAHVNTARAAIAVFG